MPIDWGDTSAPDVRRYLDLNPPPAGFDWGNFWNKVLWFGVPPDQLASNIDQAFTNLDHTMKAAGVPTSNQVVGGGVRLMTDADRALEDGFHNAADVPNQLLTTLTPYLAVGALLWVAVEIRRAR